MAIWEWSPSNPSSFILWHFNYKANILNFCLQSSKFNLPDVVPCKVQFLTDQHPHNVLHKAPKAASCHV